MQDVNVVISFYSRTGSTERMALAAALGVVNGRGNIRLRRLPEVAKKNDIEANSSWKETAERMDREYVAPREADAAWAECLIVGTPAGVGISSAEMRAFVDWLTPLGAQGRLEGKLGLAFTAGDGREENESVLTSIHAFMAKVGLIVVPFGPGGPDEVPTAERAQARGRRMAEMARALRPLSHHHD